MPGFWAEAPAGRVTRLAGATPEAIARALDPPPPGAPAVVTCRPRADRRPAAVVAGLLDELERAAVAAYPAWLPAAAPVTGRGGAAPAAVRTAALRTGATTHHFGPYLAALAARAAGTGGRGGTRFPDEVRAAGLGRALAASHDRAATALLVPPQPGLDAAGERAVLAACDWLARHGHVAVWLTGPAVARPDPVPRVTIHLPAPPAPAPPPDAEVPAAAGSARTAPSPVPPQVAVPPPGAGPPRAGAPHPASRAEQALEAALAACPWAAGRVWNQTVQPHPLANPVRVDLMWPDERCAIEIDGPEHRGALRYEADRRRDTQLHLAGFTVLRFTNDQVADDLATVLAQLAHLLTTRRNGKDRP